MTADGAWRFSARSLNLEERFGYTRTWWRIARDALALKPGARVLDVGCGPGAFTRFLTGPLEGAGTIIGLDRDGDHLREARDGTRATKGLAVNFARGDTFHLPFADATFDAVVSGFVLCVLARPLDALLEMKRVTRPGGLIASVSCFCKSGIFPRFGGLHDFDGHARLEELLLRFARVRRETVRNPALGLPNGHDLDVWGDYHMAGLEAPTIHGYLTMFAPSDARWSEADRVAFVTERGRVEADLVAGVTPEQAATMAQHGFSDAQRAELSALIERKYAWLLADPARIRDGMEVVADPAVLITARVPL